MEHNSTAVHICGKQSIPCRVDVVFVLFRREEVKIAALGDLVCKSSFGSAENETISLLCIIAGLFKNVLGCLLIYGGEGILWVRIGGRVSGRRSGLSSLR